MLNSPKSDILVKMNDSVKGFNPKVNTMVTSKFKFWVCVDFCFLDSVGA